MKRWLPIDFEECNECGSAVEALVDIRYEHPGMDDDARCVECGAVGIVNVEEDGGAWIDWEVEI